MTRLKTRIKEELKELPTTNLDLLSAAMVTATQMVMKVDPDAMPTGDLFKMIDAFWDMIIEEKQKRIDKQSK